MMKFDQYVRENMDKLNNGVEGMYLLASGIIDSGGVKVSKVGSSDDIKKKLLRYISNYRNNKNENGSILRYKCYFCFEEVES